MRVHAAAEVLVGGVLWLGCGTSAPGPLAQSSSAGSGDLDVSAQVASTSALPSRAEPRPFFEKTLAAVALGGGNQCVVDNDGTVRCFGGWSLPFKEGGSRSQDVRVPLAVGGLSAPKAMTLTYNRGCAVVDDGAVKCWGNTTPVSSGWGGAVEGKLEAVPVEGLRDAEELALGQYGSCALVKGGKIQCWGPLFSGPAHVEPRLRTLAVGPALQISSNTGRACAALKNGTVACWGRDPKAPFASRGATEEKVTLVPGLRDIVAVSVGSAHDCALSRAGKVLCWGQNDDGQLGDGSFDARKDPVEVTGLRDVVQVIASHDFSCARSAAGDVACWGENINSVLGDAHAGCKMKTMVGTMGSVEVERCPRPQPIKTSIVGASLAVGGSTACVRDLEGHIACWGHDLLGNPSREIAAPL